MSLLQAQLNLPRKGQGLEACACLATVKPLGAAAAELHAPQEDIATASSVDDEVFRALFQLLTDRGFVWGAIMTSSADLIEAVHRLQIEQPLLHSQLLVGDFAHRYLLHSC